MLHLHLAADHWNSQHKASMQVKEAIISLKKLNKLIREIEKTLGVANTTVWKIHQGKIFSHSSSLTLELVMSSVFL